LRAAVKQRVNTLVAQEHIRQSARWYQLSDDPETQRWAREKKCLVCGGDPKPGFPVCVEHYDEVFASALSNLEYQQARTELVKGLVEDCAHCNRKTRYRCGHCQAKGVRPRVGYLWCWSCGGVGAWGQAGTSTEGSGCPVCAKTGYLSEEATRAKMGSALKAIEEIVREHQRELRSQRLTFWVGKDQFHGIDISEREQVLRYVVSTDGVVELCELVAA
jgi:hypothetical protein